MPTNTLFMSKACIYIMISQIIYAMAKRFSLSNYSSPTATHLTWVIQLNVAMSRLLDNPHTYQYHNAFPERLIAFQSYPDAQM